LWRGILRKFFGNGHARDFSAVVIVIMERFAQHMIAVDIFSFMRHGGSAGFAVAEIFTVVQCDPWPMKTFLAAHFGILLSVYFIFPRPQWCPLTQG
jgi:hypothetical protein